MPFGAFGVTKVTSAVQRVEPGFRDVGRVADVMQPRGSRQQVAVPAENRGQRPRRGGDPLGVRPPARQRLGQNPAGGCLGPFCLAHGQTLCRQCRTCTDAAGPSQDVLSRCQDVLG